MPRGRFPFPFSLLQSRCVSRAEAPPVSAEGGINPPCPFSSMRGDERKWMSGADVLWDEDAEKYRVACRSVHVKKAALYIGYAQLFIILVFSLYLTLLYARASSHEDPVEQVCVVVFLTVLQFGSRFVSSMATAVALQLLLVLLLIHGVRVECRALLLPFIVLACFAVLVAIAEIFSDVESLVAFNRGERSSPYSSSLQTLSHVIGLLVHVWCVHVVWRCYSFLGDKKIAEHIGRQLNATRLAFFYEPASGCPPAYADTVLLPSDKQPLTVA